jgi:hypothetical protein
MNSTMSRQQVWRAHCTVLAHTMPKTADLRDRRASK